MDALGKEQTPSYERLMALFQAEVTKGIVARVARVNAHVAQFPAHRFPDPFLSALTRQCIELGRDVNVELAPDVQADIMRRRAHE